MSFFGKTSTQSTFSSAIGGGTMNQNFTDDLDFEIQHQFTDSVSCMKFAPYNQTYQSFGAYLLAVASWDGNVQAYQVAISGTGLQIQPGPCVNTGGPVLGMCWQQDAPFLLLAHADNNIKKWDINTNQVVSVGSHTAPVKDIYAFSVNGASIVVSGGWDSKVKFWTWQNPGQLQQIGEAYLGKPVHYMSGEYPLLVTAHSELYVNYWNLEAVFRNVFTPQGVMTSPLKFATTAIQCFPDAKGFAIGSIEGRCGIKYVDLQSDKTNTNDDFCFKCHRIEQSGQPQQLWAVNHISFNRQFGTFATFGSDGNYFIWNKNTKSRLRSTKVAPWPVTAGDFLENGQMLAFAYGYDYGKGFEETKKQKFQVKIYIRKMKQEEVFKPSSKN